MFTDRFISRPILAIALNLLLLIAGFAALASLQIRQFPRMQFTVVTVTTVYTGASADLVQGFVTQPLQEQIAAADGVDYLTSESRSGTSVITVYMRLNYDSSAAQSNILAKIQAVRSDLPLLNASGAGAASRFSIGVVIVCGLSVGTLFTLFVLPALYTYIASDHRKGAARHKEQHEAIESLQAAPKEA